MFKFLKDKLKIAVSKFSKEVDEEAETVEEVSEEDVKEIEKSEEGKTFLSKIKEKFVKVKEEEKEEKKVKKKKKPKEEKKKKEKKVKEEAKKEKLEVVKEKKKKEKAEKKKEPEEKEEVKEEKAEIVEKKEEVKEPEEEKKTFFTKVKDKFTKKEEPEEEIKEEKVEEKVEEEKEPEEKVEEKIEKPIEEFEEEEKKNIFRRVSDAVTKRSISEKKFEEFFWDLEMVLLENNVAVEVVEKIKDDLKDKLVDTKVRIGKTEEVITSTLEKSIEGLFDIEKINLIRKIREKKPFVICFFGVNGSGKTTTLAKIAKLLEENNLSCVIAAADTFRAAAINQLEEHAKKLDVKLIKHDYGSDPAAVAYDAVKHAKAKNKDVVLIDTAGRQHSNINLMDEMKKIIRVVNPDLNIFVGDSLTGNDAVEQSRQFDEAIGIDGIILTKVDVDEKGGAALSISYVTGKPIIYVGIGQSYEDLKEFDKNIVLDSLALEA